jgi:hypothetical protein
MSLKPHLIVIGNGMAGCRAVEEILARDAGKYRITIFGAEPRVNYNRIMLSPLLAGEKSSTTSSSTTSNGMPTTASPWSPVTRSWRSTGASRPLRRGPAGLKAMTG